MDYGHTNIPADFSGITSGSGVDYFEEPQKIDEIPDVEYDSSWETQGTLENDYNGHNENVKQVGDKTLNSFSQSENLSPDDSRMNQNDPLMPPGFTLETVQIPESSLEAPPEHSPKHIGIDEIKNAEKNPWALYDLILKTRPEGDGGNI